MGRATARSTGCCGGQKPLRPMRYIRPRVRRLDGRPEATEAHMKTGIDRSRRYSEGPLVGGGWGPELEACQISRCSARRWRLSGGMMT